MSMLPKQIAEKFLEELAKSEVLCGVQIKRLQELMERPSKLKADDIEPIFTVQEETTL